MDLRSPLTPIPAVKALINVGACMDIPNGFYVPGRHGEMILNGGLGAINATVGAGNLFKTTLLLYKMLRAMARMGPNAAGGHYDTEINVHPDRIAHLAKQIPEFNGEDVLLTGRWVITDKVQYTGDVWFDLTKKYMMDKKAAAKSLMVETPFMNRERNENIKIIMPTFGLLDSLTEFTTKDVIAMQDDNDLGDSGANTLFMRQGIQKTRLLTELPQLCGASGHYFGLTGQMGAVFNMDPRNPEKKKLSHIKGNDKMKGVTDKFTFATNSCLQCARTSVLINQGTKGPEYPLDGEDDTKLDPDLNELFLTELRGKSGPSGTPLSIVISQRDGVQPTMTEFLHIKEDDRWGLEGNNLNYNLALFPDAKLGRTTVRRKIAESLPLQRAMNITSEMLQIHNLMPEYRHSGLLCTPKELFDDLKAKGYDWDELLATRGWWTINNDDHPEKFLSTLDLLRMRKDLYKPYWM